MCVLVADLFCRTGSHGFCRGHFCYQASIYQDGVKNLKALNNRKSRAIPLAVQGNPALGLALKSWLNKKGGGSCPVNSNWSEKCLLYMHGSVLVLALCSEVFVLYWCFFSCALNLCGTFICSLLCGSLSSQKVYF